MRGGGSGDLKGRRELAQLVSVTLLMSQLLIGWSNLAAPDGEHPCTREGSDDGGSLSRAEDHLTAESPRVVFTLLIFQLSMGSLKEVASWNMSAHAHEAGYVGTGWAEGLRIGRGSSRAHSRYA